MSTTTTTRTDVIDQILGVAEGSLIAKLRGQQPLLAEQLQDYYDALFEPTPESAAAFPLADRSLVAIRVAAYTRSSEVVDWYAALATADGADADLIARAKTVETAWTDQTPLGAAIRHTDLVTQTPSETRPEHLQALKDAGYSPAGILSLAQTIAFVNYQLRLIAGLRAFGATV
jgi:CMD domain protein